MASFSGFDDIAPPDCFVWLYGTFIDLYNASDGEITTATISGYQDLLQFRFSIYETQLVLRMKKWADDEKMKLSKERTDA